MELVMVSMLASVFDVMIKIDLQGVAGDAEARECYEVRRT
jgi:hypothetical protein